MRAFRWTVLCGLLFLAGTGAGLIAARFHAAGATTETSGSTFPKQNRRPMKIQAEIVQEPDELLLEIGEEDDRPCDGMECKVEDPDPVDSRIRNLSDVLRNPRSKSDAPPPFSLSISIEKTGFSVRVGDLRPEMIPLVGEKHDFPTLRAWLEGASAKIPSDTRVLVAPENATDMLTVFETFDTCRAAGLKCSRLEVAAATFPRTR